MKTSTELITFLPALFVAAFLMLPVMSSLGVAPASLNDFARYVYVKVPPDGELLKIYFTRGSVLISLTGFDFGPVVNTLLLAASVSATVTALTLLTVVGCLGMRSPWRMVFGYLLPYVASLPAPLISAYAVLHLFHRDFGLINAILEKAFGVRVALEGIVGVYLYQVLSFLPLSHLVVLTYLDSIDRGLVEVAYSLGAQGTSVVKDILIPLAKPALIASGTLVFVLSAEDLAGPVAFSRYNSARNLLAYIAYYDFVSEYGFTVSTRAIVYIIVLTLLAVSAFLSSWKYLRAHQYPIALPRVLVIDLGKLGYVVATLSGTLVTFSAIPKFMVFLYSVTDGWYGSRLPSRLAPENFLKIFFNPYYLRAILNTAVYTVIAVAIAIALAWLFAYTGYRVKAKLSPLNEVLVALPMAVPGIAVGIGYFTLFHMLFRDFPPLDPMVNPSIYLVVALSARRLPYAVRPVATALQKVPKSMEEQALNLGAGHAMVLRTVTIPLVSNASVVAALLTSAYVATEFSVSLVLTGGFGVSASHPAPVVPVILNMMTYNPLSIHIASAMLITSLMLSALCSAIVALVMLKEMSGLRWRSLVDTIRGAT